MSNEINQSQNTKRKVYGSIFIVLVLSVMLALTTVALFASVLTSEDNFFETAQVKIDVNDGQVLFDGNMHIEPGMTLKEDLVIKNLSTVDVYYRLYLENVVVFCFCGRFFGTESVCRAGDLATGPNQNTFFVRTNERNGRQYVSTTIDSV